MQRSAKLVNSAQPFRSCSHLLSADRGRLFRPVAQNFAPKGAGSLSRRTVVASPLLSSIVATAAMAETRGAMKWTKYPGEEQEYVTLNNGVKMPLLGLGTSGGKGEETKKAVQHALLNGYRHIDTARMYGNEDAVGEGIKVLDRKDVFITTKLGNDEHGRVEEAVREQLKDLKTDYIDLYLIHWPLAERVKDGKNDPSIESTWRAMEKLYEEGLLKAIGISNFSVKKTKELQAFAKIQPAVNQVEVHVWHRNNPINDYCLQQGIQIQAYSPMGGTPNWEKDPPWTDPTVVEIAKKNGKTPNQVLLRWNLQHGSCVIPKSTNPKRIDENKGIWDWSLSQEDYDKLSSIKFQVRMCDGVKQGFVDDGPYESVEDLWDGEA